MPRADGRAGWKLACIAAALVLAGCSGTPVQAPPAPASAAGPSATPGTVAASARFAIHRASAGDSLRTLARQYLGDESRSTEIADFNDITEVLPGMTVVIPARPANRTGVSGRSFQTVTILAYHRFGRNRSKMAVTPEDFAAQMQYLADHHYRVIRLSEVEAFLDGRAALPERAVAITMDDGYASTYHVALPTLRQHGFPATLFVYTDFIGGGDALTWPQMQAMQESGLVEIQSHSKSHADLALKHPGEEEDSYLGRVDKELRAPRDLLHSRLGIDTVHLAYPYGSANEQVARRTHRAGYQLAMTVDPGGNPFFAHPLMLKRTMIFGDQGIESFKARLQSRREYRQP